jgi:hypothetical protein
MKWKGRLGNVTVWVTSVHSGGISCFWGIILDMGSAPVDCASTTFHQSCPLVSDSTNTLGWINDPVCTACTSGQLISATITPG